VVALQTQVPLEQTAPAPHAAPFPHAQAPVTGSHPSAAVALQAIHAPPPVPQVLRDGTLQTPLAQQPLGQDWALHTHAPATQTVPVVQAGLVLQRHSPDEAQMLARVMSQVTHAEPAVPQAFRPAGEQVVPEQQPFAQLLAVQPLHTPPEQVWVPQFWQVAPPLPQEASAVPATQLVPAQQPLGHDVPSHTHVPPEQR
jgi:hypothetical protein